MLRVEGEAAFVTEANRDLVPKPPNLQTVVAINRGPFLPRPPLPERLADVPGGRPAARRAHQRGLRRRPRARARCTRRRARRASATASAGCSARRTRRCWWRPTRREARNAARLLQAAGFLHQRGWVTPEQVGTAESFAVLELDELVAGARDGSLQVVDVREPTETPAPLPGAHQVPLRLVAGDDLGGPRSGAADRRGLRRRLAGRDGRLPAGAPRLHGRAPGAGRRHEPRPGRRGVGRRPRPARRAT